MNGVSDDGKVDFSFNNDDLNGNDETRCKLVTDSEWKTFEAEQKKSPEMLLDLYKGILPYLGWHNGLENLQKKTSSCL